MVVIDILFRYQWGSWVACIDFDMMMQMILQKNHDDYGDDLSDDGNGNERMLETMTVTMQIKLLEVAVDQLFQSDVFDDLGQGQEWWWWTEERWRRSFGASTSKMTMMKRMPMSKMPFCFSISQEVGFYLRLGFLAYGWSVLLTVNSVWS